MKSLRWILPSLALAALLVSGCILISAQIFAHFSLANPIVLDSNLNPLHREPVDLHTISDYEKNKDKLKGLSDLAVVGRFTNQAGPAGAVELWISPDFSSNLGSVAAVQSGATKLWGPGSIGAAVTSRTIGWNESSKLFNPAGKKILIDEALGDGQFVVYAIVTGPGPNTIRVDNGEIILVIDAGK